MGRHREGLSHQDREGAELRHAVAILMLCWGGLALAGGLNDSFQQGKDLGGSVVDSGFSGVNSGAAADKVPAYGTNPPETNYYQVGQGDIEGPGAAKIQNCAGYTPGSNEIANQECEAVNFLARNPQIRPQFNITKNDPMILGAKNARNNAESFFQSLGVNGGAGSGTQCTTKTETTPAQYTTQTCSSIKELGTQQCTMGRVISIDDDANFQCNQTLNGYETLTCTRSPQISVTPGCKDNSDLFVAQSDPCPGCVDYLVTLLRCDAASNQYVARFGSRLKNGSGCYSLYTDGVWDPSYNACWIDGDPKYVAITPGASLSNVTLVERMDGGYCYREIGNFTCSPSVCTVETYFSNPCQGTSSYLSTPAFGLLYKLSGISWQDGCAALEQRAQ